MVSPSKCQIVNFAKADVYHASCEDFKASRKEFWPACSSCHKINRICTRRKCLITLSVLVSKLLTLLLVYAKSDLSVEDPSVLGAEYFKVDGRVVAAHFASTSYLPSCGGFLCVILRDSLLLQEIRYETSHFFG